MYRQSFVKHHPANGHPSPLHDIIWQLPLEWMPHRDSLIRQAGFDPANKPRIGVTMAWGNHKTRSIIVASDINFTEPFAVSVEPI